MFSYFCKNDPTFETKLQRCKHQVNSTQKNKFYELKCSFPNIYVYLYILFCEMKYWLAIILRKGNLGNTKQKVLHFHFCDGTWHNTCNLFSNGFWINTYYFYPSLKHSIPMQISLSILPPFTLQQSPFLLVSLKNTANKNASHDVFLKTTPTEI